MNQSSFAWVVPQLVSNRETCYRSFRTWVHARNEMFSAITGENVTNIEVIVTNVAIIAMFFFAALMNVIVTVLEGGAL